VFLNSHLLSEVELVSDRVAIMLKGKVERQGSLAELTDESRRWRVSFEGAPPAWIGEFGAAAATAPGRFAVEFPSDDLARVQSLIDRLRADGLAVVGVTETRESLEDLFMRLVRDVDGRARAVGASNVNSARADGGAQ
jgi:ABC-2 type transport system ATP-binding protein